MHRDVWSAADHAHSNLGCGSPGRIPAVTGPAGVGVATPWTRMRSRLNDGGLDVAVVLDVPVLVAGRTASVVTDVVATAPARSGGDAGRGRWTGRPPSPPTTSAVATTPAPSATARRVPR